MESKPELVESSQLARIAEAEAEKVKLLASIEPVRSDLDLLPPEVLERVSAKAEEKLEQESWSRREKREKEPMVQMSIRMREETYEVFRKLCIANRLTNGEMLEVMMASYLQERDNGSAVS
jgi:hypothetical protein